MNPRADSENSNTTNLLNLPYTGPKAGLDGQTKDFVNKIIQQNQTGSTYYARQDQKKENQQVVVQECLARLTEAKKDKTNLAKHQQEFEILILEIQESQDLTRVWAHFDIDMFYAAIEIRDRPELENLPVAVGSESMISTCNYVARKFGIRSAMPGFIAKKLCKDLVFVPSNMPKYRIASEKFFGVLKNYDSEVESMGSDEARLDLTEYLEENSISGQTDIEKLISGIREEIF
jgi:DNA polymerase kappa